MTASRIIGNVQLTDEIRSAIINMIRRIGVESSLENGSLPTEIGYGQNLFDVLKPWIDPPLGNGHLSIGLPPDRFCGPKPGRPTGYEVFWFPNGIPSGRSICIASSRLGRNLDSYDQWFDAIRTMAARLDPDSNFFLTAESTTTNEFIRRIGELYGFSVVSFRPVDDQNSCPPMMENLERLSQRGADCRFCYIAESIPGPAACDSDLQASIDHRLILNAQQVRLLSVRKGGNIFQAAKQRLVDHPDEDTRLLIDSRLTKNKVQQALVSLGATAWWLYQDSTDSVIQAGSNNPTVVPNIQPSQRTDVSFGRPPVPILDASEVQPERYLLHWTRRRVGPWPGQSIAEYLDDLIFRSSRRKHGELAALARILASQKILATNQLTRDDQSVVCFSQLPLNNILERKVYRKHLGRWDFQPFGIAIDKDRLAEMGAQPVIYGDEKVWDSLTEQQRPFFQLAITRNQKIDWREEEEWRLIGDLDLRQVGPGAVVIFVPSYADAEVVASLSRWPIVCLDV